MRIIVGFAAGSLNDIIARLVGQWLSERLGKPFITENRPGSGGNIAVEAVVNAPPDGYTLLMVSTPNAVNATSDTSIRNITPVAGIMRMPNVMTVSPSLPVRRFLSSSPMPRRVPARSIWVRPGSRSIWRASCSK